MVGRKTFPLVSGDFVVRLRYLLIVLLLLLGLSCTEVTEQNILYTAGLNVYSLPDLSLIASIDVDSDGRCMTVSNEGIFVACTDGYMRSYSRDDHSLIEENQIGPASPSGYSDCEFNIISNSIYLIGTTGNVLEIDIPDCSVVDQFSPCSSPVELEVTMGSPGYLWVVDGQSNRIHQVHLMTNGHCGSIGYPPHFGITAIEASSYDDSLLVGTTDGFFRLETTGPGVFRSSWVKGVSENCLSLSGIPGDSNYVAVVQYGSSSKIGELCVYDDSTYAIPPSKFYNSFYLSGNYPILEPGGDGEFVYALTSYNGEGLLTTYSVGIGSREVNQVAVPGNPLDLAVSEGEIYVLTYE